MAEAAIDAMLTKLKKAFVEADTATLSTFYTEDCQVLYAQMDVINGRKAFNELIASGMEKGSFTKAEVQRLSFIDAGDHAIETSIWKVFGPGNKLVYNTKSSVVYRKDKDGQWRIHIECSNENPST